MRLCLVIPVYNEEKDLPICLKKLVSFCRQEIKDWEWSILIADNGSSDQTWLVAQELSKNYPEATAVKIETKGRGLALKKTWGNCPADSLFYMDVDLATDLSALPEALKKLKEGSDIVIGSRLLPQSRVQRGLNREMISRVYNLLIRIFFQTSFHDAQCGFKGISATAAKKLLPQVKDNQWFFDTELLLLADSQGFKISEIPVIWHDDTDSRVDILRTIKEDLKGLWRLRAQSRLGYKK